LIILSRDFNPADRALLLEAVGLEFFAGADRYEDSSLADYIRNKLSTKDLEGIAGAPALETGIPSTDRAQEFRAEQVLDLENRITKLEAQLLNDRSNTALILQWADLVAEKLREAIKNKMEELKL